MSVSGIPSSPAGFDVLFPSTTPSNASSGTSSSAPAATTVPADTAGSDVLNAPLNTPTVPGFDILQPAAEFPGATSGQSSTSSTGSSTGSSTATQNPYQAAYNSIETWSDNYLLQSVENGAPSTVPEYSGGESANSFASLNTLLAQIKPLIAIDGAEQQGTTGSKPSSGTGSTGATVDALA